MNQIKYKSDCVRAVATFGLSRAAAIGSGETGRREAWADASADGISPRSVSSVGRFRRPAMEQPWAFLRSSGRGDAENLGGAGPEETEPKTRRWVAGPPCIER